MKKHKTNLIREWDEKNRDEWVELFSEKEKEDEEKENDDDEEKKEEKDEEKKNDDEEEEKEEEEKNIFLINIDIPPPAPITISSFLNIAPPSFNIPPPSPLIAAPALLR